MSNKRETTAALLRHLAQGRSIDQAASDLGVSVEMAREVLEKIADLYAPSRQDPVEHSESAVAYIDGGARGNPGPAGCGVFIQDQKGETLITTARYLGETTNNVAEYNGLLVALETAQEIQIEKLEIRSDSKLLVEQMKGNYKVKSPNLIPLFLKAQKLAHQFENVVYTHVRREQNRKADRLANEAMDSGARR